MGYGYGGRGVIEWYNFIVILDCDSARLYVCEVLCEMRVWLTI